MLDIKIKKITLVSYPGGFGPPPDFDEEVMQRLTISSNGRVWFTSYIYGNDRQVVGRKMQLNIGQEEANITFSLILRYFEDDYNVCFAPDAGGWELKIIGIDQKEHKFKGSLCEDLFVEDMGIFEYIREHISIDDLFVFGGNIYDNEENDDE